MSLENSVLHRMLPSPGPLGSTWASVAAELAESNAKSLSHPSAQSSHWQQSLDSLTLSFEQRSWLKISNDLSCQDGASFLPDFQQSAWLQDGGPPDLLGVSLLHPSHALLHRSTEQMPNYLGRGVSDCCAVAMGTREAANPPLQTEMGLSGAGHPRQRLQADQTSSGGRRHNTQRGNITAGISQVGRWGLPFSNRLQRQVCGSWLAHKHLLIRM